MKMRIIQGGLLAVLLAVTLGCATLEIAGHKYIMRGSILDVTDGTAYLCIGTEEGAEVGQEFTVYRYTRVYGRQARGVYYKVETVGKVKITQTESHMASAKILSGNVEKSDVVELNP